MTWIRLFFIFTQIQSFSIQTSLPKIGVGAFKNHCMYDNIFTTINHWQSLRTHCYHIFLWLCAWDVCYIIFCHLLYIHSGKTQILFSLLLLSFWRVQIVRYVLACRSYAFVCTLHHPIIIVLTYRKTYIYSNWHDIVAAVDAKLMFT